MGLGDTGQRMRHPANDVRKGVAGGMTRVPITAEDVRAVTYKSGDALVTPLNQQYKVISTTHDHSGTAHTVLWSASGAERLARIIRAHHGDIAAFRDQHEQIAWQFARERGLT
jgi:hypothetical protein